MKYLKLSRLYFILGLFAVSLTACGDNDELIPLNSEEQTVSLNIASTNLTFGEQVTVTPVFQPNVTPKRKYSWSNSHPEVAELVANDDYSAVVTGKTKGTTKLTFSSEDGTVQASVNVSVAGINDDGVLKILAIGNSFSEDALEQYLHEMGRSTGIKMVIGNLYIGGSTLEMHYTNATDDAAVYSYRKIVENGSKTSTPNTSISSALTEENWDYISFQQQSGLSGIYDTYVEHLPGLVEYVKDVNDNPETQYILHQTWAYASTSTHADFPNYDNDQEKMYAAITQAVRQAQELVEIDLVVPAGTAIQNVRNTFLGDVLTRDGYHLSLALGRYTAASTWFTALTGRTVVGNSIFPDELNATEVAIAQKAAEAAVAKPDEVTILTDYQTIEPKPLTAPVLVNFGRKEAAKWNTLADHNEGASLNNMKDENDEFTGVSLVITERFNNINMDGETAVTTPFEIPDEVSTQSYYGNPKASFGGMIIEQSQIKISGLDKTQSYTFCFFASRKNVGDNRETKHIVEGDNSETVYLNPSNNKSEVVCTGNITPDSNGEITITFTAGENNTNGTGFYYVGAMRIAPGE